jgi:hypothetical protein
LEAEYTNGNTLQPDQKKAQVPMGRRCQKRLEKEETYKMGRTSPKSS